MSNITKEADSIDKKIETALESLRPLIDSWRLTPEANIQPHKINKQGVETIQKSPNAQLADPPSMTSPLQLSILLYDILKIPIVDKKTPRGTGEDILLKNRPPINKINHGKTQCGKNL